MKPVQLSTPDDSDEIARAELYGLLARLFLAPPDDDLLARLRLAPTAAPVPGAFLESSWTDLVGAARAADAAQIAAEHDALFVGIGKPEVFLYASHHIAGALNEKPLVELRDTLRRLGLARSEAMVETEDHVAYLCEVMRYLIAGDDLAISNLASQQRFFDAHLRGWSARMLEQLAAHPQAAFYRALALFAAAFLQVEAQAFDMLEA